MHHRSPRRIPLLLLFTSCTLALAHFGCSSDGPADRTFEEQVEVGAELYGEHCASCHGDSGQGTADAPAVVGEGALPEEPPDDRQFRENDFNTAADVYVFASEYMPATDPDSVSDQEMVDILAFALFANGVELDSELTLDSADEVVLHE
jgi:S-disulfanyl-L-cysteine oxidoreductase SoxD